MTGVVVGRGPYVRMTVMAQGDVTGEVAGAVNSSLSQIPNYSRRSSLSCGDVLAWGEVVEAWTSWTCMDQKDGSSTGLMTIQPD